MARIRQKRKPHAEMNVVPYIDVMLVLLVIFMVTAPMLTQGVKIELPKVAAQALATDAEQQILTLSVQADGGYYWNLGSELNTEQQTDSAVNLDEEAVNLLTYQQAYQAAAKVMQTAQTIFDELMRVAAR